MTSTVPLRRVGASGLLVSAVGLGCNNFGRRLDLSDTRRVLHAASDAGVTFLATADLYGGTDSERFMGEALKGRRDQVVIATKFGFADGSPVKGADSRPERIRLVVDDQLRRLRTAHIDLLYQHRVDPDVPIEDVVGTMSDLIHEGKVRFLGLSEAGEQTIRRGHAVHPISAVQSEYSLWERNLEPQIIPLLRELGIGLVPFAPLGRGFLAGPVKRAEEYPADDFRHGDPRYQGENFDANVRAAKAVRDLHAVYEKLEPFGDLWIFRRSFRQW